jgi:oxalate decarboxylase/phosphoglucose isomerase-like protein (cupin superfamily)
MSDPNKAHFIDLPTFFDPNGNLACIEEENHIPFQIARVYWIYDVPGGEMRGGHAFKTHKEFIVALSGSFDVILDNGEEKQVLSLNRSHYGLYVPQLVWRTIENFSTNSLCLIIASEKYDATDYIRDYNEFKNFITE